MGMQGIVGVSLALLLLLAGCANSSDGEPRARQSWVPDGDPVSCISKRQIRSTHVVDDRTINFVMNNRRMYRNELPFACSGLSFQRAFKTNSRSSQLCSSDSIRVVQPGMTRGGFACSLGRFQPMKPVAAAEAVAGG